MEVQLREPLAKIMLARYYSAQLGRFLTADSVRDVDPENPQSWNKYSYVRNDPVQSIDPSGHVGFDGGVVEHDFQAEVQPGGPEGQGAGDLFKTVLLYAMRHDMYCGYRWTGGKWDGTFDVEPVGEFDTDCQFHDLRTIACAGNVACQAAADAALSRAALSAETDGAYEKFIYKPVVVIYFDLNSTALAAASFMQIQSGGASGGAAGHGQNLSFWLNEARNKKEDLYRP